MININFFEKRKINILPYIAGGAILLILIIISISFFFIKTRYEKVIEENNEWIYTNAEDVNLSREIKQFDQLAKQSLDFQEILNENQYPMYTIIEGLTSAIPEEANQVTSFQFIEENQITLILENTNITLGRTITEDLEMLSYVTGVQLVHAESQNEEDDQLRYELIIDVNENSINEEETK